MDSRPNLWGRLLNKVICVWYVLQGKAVVYRFIVTANSVEAVIGPTEVTNRLYLIESDIFPWSRD